MKKTLDKINKVLFWAGILAVVILILCVVNIENGMLDGMIDYVIMGYLVIIGIFVIFLVIAFVMAMIEGWKKDKVAFLKEFISNSALMLVACMVGVILDYFTEEVSMKFDLYEMLIHVLITACAIVAGKYMISKHDDVN